MAWDESKTHSHVVAQRLLLSPPHVVYDGLAAYGTRLLRDQWSADEHIERSLAARDDKLVTLGLAQFGGVAKVLSGIYNRVSLDTSDVIFRRAVRLAVLANRTCSGALYAWHETASETLRSIVDIGDDDEMRALLANSLHRGLLAKLYARSGVFADIDDEEWPRLVGFTCANPGLNVDEDNEHGPDMVRMDVHRNLWDLVRQAPITADWLRVLHRVLVSLVGGITATPKSLDDVRAALARWEGVKVPGYREGQESEGFYTSLSITQEFRCLVAALYGRVLGDGKWLCLSGPDDADQVARCAYYGIASMTPEQMQAAQLKDDQVFTFAAVFNTSFYLTPQCRAELESALARPLSYKYQETCKELAKRHRYFRAEPVSAELAEESREPETPELVARDADVKALAAQVLGLQVELGKFSRWAFLGFVVIAVIAYVR